MVVCLQPLLKPFAHKRDFANRCVTASVRNKQPVCDVEEDVAQRIRLSGSDGDGGDGGQRERETCQRAFERPSQQPIRHQLIYARESPDHRETHRNSQSDTNSSTHVSHMLTTQGRRKRKYTTHAIFLDNICAHVVWPQIIEGNVDSVGRAPNAIAQRRGC